MQFLKTEDLHKLWQFCHLLATFKVALFIFKMTAFSKRRGEPKSNQKVLRLTLFHANSLRSLGVEKIPENYSHKSHL